MNNKIKKLISVFLTFMIIFSLYVIPISANESLTFDEENIIREELTKYGVVEETQDNLINKLKSGEVWDSMSGRHIELVPQETDFDGNSYYSKTIYPDGSIKIANVEVPESTESDSESRSVTGGTWQSGSSWWSVTGALVKENYMVFTATFRADYSGNQYQASKISRVYEYNIATVGASYSNPHFSITRPQATSTTPARAYLCFDVTLYSGSGGFTQYVYLYVIGTKATSDRS